MDAPSSIIMYKEDKYITKRRNLIWQKFISFLLMDLKKLKA